MRMLDVVLDNATTRLTKAAQATAAVEALPKDSARTLVATCRAVRLFVEAQEHKAAVAALDDAKALVATMDQGHVRDALERRLEAAGKALP